MILAGGLTPTSICIFLEGGAIGGLTIVYSIEKSFLQATGFNKLSLQTTFLFSTVYGQKLGPILQSAGFENAQLHSTEKSIGPHLSRVLSQETII